MREDYLILKIKNQIHSNLPSHLAIDYEKKLIPFYFSETQYCFLLSFGCTLQRNLF
jgi:hypothetical protein